MRSLLILSMLFMASTTFSQTKPTWNSLIGSAFTDSRGYEVMNRICDEAGSRLMGSENYEKALTILETELKTDGLTSKRESFSTLCWYRGNDEVEMISPVARKLKATTIGYVHSCPEFSAQAIFAGGGAVEDLTGKDIKGKIMVIAREGNFGRAGLTTKEIIVNAMNAGVKAILMFNSEASGFLAIARTGSFTGDTVRIPVFNITCEEGLWLKRLSDEGKPATIRISTKSFCKVNTVSNLVVSIPGKVKDKIVVGAHFDSWDLGQGAIDNGLGSAIIFDMARLINQINPKNYYSIDFVWFTGEEMGLVGSKKYVQMHSAEKIIANINFDMTGTPIGFNAMGFDEYKPFLQNLITNLDGFEMKDGVKSTPWTGSDHLPFIIAGIPALMINGKLDEPMYKYYHEAGDTWDKFGKKYMSETVAVGLVMLFELANNTELVHKQYSEAETIELLKKFKIDEQLKKTGEWKFKTE